MLQRSPLSFFKLSYIKILGYRVAALPASLGANAPMSTVWSIALDVAYPGISPGTVAVDVVAEALGVSK